MFCADARSALDKIPPDSVDAIITSPPYGNLKDYGSEQQIGFGQDHIREYLPDLESVFQKLYRVAKPGAALWLVLDMMKDQKEVLSLPWEAATRARNAGWDFQDLIVWDKGRGLPWSHKGRFRGVCEYILLLSKGSLTHFNLDSVRDSQELSPYWVRYPERYHPDGKAPSDLWHFPIPVQGSWSEGDLRHFCPFPVSLVARMISITTRNGDIVLDPFSGTGSVLGVAAHLNRRGLGLEINPKFVDQFERTGFESLAKQCQAEIQQPDHTGSSLREAIVSLRMLKYPKTLFTELSRSDRLSQKSREYIASFVIRSTTVENPDEGNHLDTGKLGSLRLAVLAKTDADVEALRSAIVSCISVRPLTKFGIAVEVEVFSAAEWDDVTFTSKLADQMWYIYRRGTFYQFSQEVEHSTLGPVLRDEARDNRRKVPSIVSSLKIHIPKPDGD